MSEKLDKCSSFSLNWFIGPAVANLVFTQQGSEFEPMTIRQAFGKYVAFMPNCTAPHRGANSCPLALTDADLPHNPTSNPVQT